jgi:hypothetical protein
MATAKRYQVSMQKTRDILAGFSANFEFRRKYS